MILRCFWLLFSLLSLVLADVEFVGPSGGDSISGLRFEIEWKDSGDSPKISSLVTYQLFLCAGGNKDTEYIQLATLVQQGDFTKGNKVTGTITAGLGANVKDAYFLKIVSAATGGIIINFSERFSLTSMTGVFPPVVVSGLKNVDGTDGPPTVNQISSPQAGAAAGGQPAANGDYGVTYTMQTGQVRFAPMPMTAVSKISAKHRSMLYPTSDYTVYKTVQGPPNAITTNTQPFGFSTQSREATVAPAGNPTDTAMAKYLNRWKD